jgi:cell division transport system permease protein
MLTFLLRTIKYAFQDFWRNIWLSLITVTVILFALFSFNSLVLVKTVSDYTLQTIEKKIDVSVFINSGIEENQALDLRARLLGLSEVKEVIYISSDEALDSMIKNHQDDPAIIQSLEELGTNPLGSQLIVQAQGADQYKPIVDLLNEERYDAIIADKNFDEHTYIIERVSDVSNQVRSVATFMTILFTIIALIVVYNTLRIIIYTHREEIAIMRLVGATNWFIRMPYIWESLIYAFFGMGIFLLLWYPLLGFVQPFVDEIFVEGSAINLITFYNVNSLFLFGLQVLGLVLLLSIASILATRKYSRV